MERETTDGGVISVVIVTYDSAACAAGALASIGGTLPGAEIIVVDNNSQDDTLAVVRSAAPDARVIAGDENLGFGRACNTGAQVALGSHVLFMNPDAGVTAVDGERLARLLLAEPFGLVAPALDGQGDRRLPETSWRREYVAHTFETLRPRGWRRRPRRARQADVWVAGGLLLVSREEFLGLGGFDARFFLYYEDRDLSSRYREAGLPIRETDAIRGRHQAGTSSASDTLRAGPMAWSFLGWIQYVFIHDGERTARRAARTTLATVRLLRLLVGALAALGSARARRKADQLDELLRLLREHTMRDDARFCPDALRVLRGLD
jgi:GT2 family glycosyltransferase